MRPSERINVHPPTHDASKLTTTTFDVICIGSGWAGHVLAARVVRAGLTALIIEAELIGGECPFWACVPSKTLLRSPQALEAARRVGGARERITEDRVAANATFRRRDRISMNWDDTVVVAPMIEGAGVTILRGHGRTAGVKTVEVVQHGGSEAIKLEATQAVALCTGSEPVLPDIPGLEAANPWTPRDATSSRQVPQHLVILGAGAVGCEMATAYVKLGAQVSIISHGELLPGAAPRAGELVEESLRSQGVTLELGAAVASVKRTSDGTVELRLSSGKVVRGTELLIAAGRKARLTDVGLEHVGLPIGGNRFLEVHENMRVKGVDGGWLFAVGDINGRGVLTHVSKYQATIAANTIVARAKMQIEDDREWSAQSATADHRALPNVIFTDPVVASVGMTQRQAEREGLHVREVSVAMASPDGIQGDDESPGWAQWLFDDQDRLVGATFVGTNAAEQLHASTVAIVGGLTLDRLRHAIPSWPTLSWVYYDLLDAADTSDEMSRSLS